MAAEAKLKSDTEAEWIREPDKVRGTVGERIWGPYKTHAGSNVTERYSAGPHGLGDPEDRRMRKVEKEILVAQIIKKKSKAIYCSDEYEAFQKCCEKQGAIKMVISCKQPSNILKECLGRVQRNPKIIHECTEEYLDGRAEYRRTGLRKPLKRM